MYLQVNGDWISDFGDTLSGAAQSVASTLGDKKTWDQVSAAFESILIRQIFQTVFERWHHCPFEGAGDSAADWATEAWASTEAGAKCLKVDMAPKISKISKI